MGRIAPEMFWSTAYRLRARGAREEKREEQGEQGKQEFLSLLFLLSLLSLLSQPRPPCSCPPLVHGYLF